MAGRKPKKVGMTMMYDNGLIPVMVFEKYFLGSGLVYSNKSVGLLAILDKCYRCIPRHCSHRVESEACHEANSDHPEDYRRYGQFDARPALERMIPLGKEFSGEYCHC